MTGSTFAERAGAKEAKFTFLSATLSLPLNRFREFVFDDYTLKQVPNISIPQGFMGDERLFVHNYTNKYPLIRYNLQEIL